MTGQVQAIREQKNQAVEVAKMITGTCSTVQRLMQSCVRKKWAYRDKISKNGDFIGTEEVEAGFEIIPQSITPDMGAQIESVARAATTREIIFCLHGLAKHKRYAHGEDSFEAVISETAMHLHGQPIGAIVAACEWHKFEDQSPWFPASSLFCTTVKGEAKKITSLLKQWQNRNAPRLVKHKPEPEEISEAERDEVKSLWQGLVKKISPTEPANEVKPEL